MVASPKDINPNNEPTVLCPECGVPIPVSMEKCPYCGIRMPYGCKMLAIRTAVAVVAIIAAIIALVVFTRCSSNEPYKMVDGKIICHTPKRPKGQQDMLQFAAEPLDTVRVGFIGLGSRGKGGPKRWSQIEGTKIVALCDLKQECIDKAQEYLAKAGRPRAVEYTGSEDAWKKICERDDIDLVYVATPWASHVEMTLYAMECGKHVAVEVPAAFTLEELWQIIDTAERTRKHCMMLENCIYDFFELTALNMAQQGVFGEILHTEGAYIHSLDHSMRRTDRTWRVDHLRNFRGDAYPTHGLGPLCLVLDIHRGDRFKTLVAMDTKAVMGPDIYASAHGEKLDDFQNGDQTTTLIRTENGKVIQLHHNIVTPRPYSRDYALVGTQGYAVKYPIQAFRIGNDVPEGVNPVSLKAHPFMSDEERDALLEQYKHPIIKEVGEVAKKVGGHGGMDFIMDYRLVYCLRNGLPLDMDVYDLAEWSCPAALSSISIKHGSMPVEVPDFTRGAWKRIDGYKFAYKE